MPPALAQLAGVAVFPLALCATAAARSPADEFLSQPARAHDGTWELELGTDYLQGVGTVAPGHDLSDIAGTGAGVSAAADYRFAPRWSLGAEGQYQGFIHSKTSSARGFAANVGATYHVDPSLRGDPWLRFGTGYLLIRLNDLAGESSAAAMLWHGFDVLSATMGYDVRLSENIALAPVIRADFDLFVWQDSSTAGSHPLARAQVGTFLYGGLQVRFDWGEPRAQGGAP